MNSGSRASNRDQEKKNSEGEYEHRKLGGESVKWDRVVRAATPPNPAGGHVNWGLEGGYGIWNTTRKFLIDC